MHTNLEIEKWFDDLNKLIQDIFICYRNLSDFYDLRSKNKILQQDFFHFFSYQQFFMINIQLAKIFESKKQQERNIITLCNKIIKGDYDSDIKGIFEIKKRYMPCSRFIEEIKNVAKIQRKVIKKKQIIIDKVTKTRNKVYAHTDIEKIKDFPTLQELEELVELSSKIFNSIRGQLYGINTDFSKGLISLKLKDLIRLLGLKQQSPYLE